MTTRAVLAALTLSLMLGTPPAVAQPADEVKTLRKEVDALKEGQSAIQKQLEEVLKLLRSGGASQAARPPSAPPQNLVVSVEGAPFKGKPDAKVTLVEYTDYQ